MQTASGPCRAWHSPFQSFQEFTGHQLPTSSERLSGGHLPVPSGSGPGRDGVKEGTSLCLDLLLPVKPGAQRCHFVCSFKIYLFCLFFGIMALLFSCSSFKNSSNIE